MPRDSNLIAPRFAAAHGFSRYNTNSWCKDYISIHGDRVAVVVNQDGVFLCPNGPEGEETFNPVPKALIVYTTNDGPWDIPCLPGEQSLEDVLRKSFFNDAAVDEILGMVSLAHPKLQPKKFKMCCFDAVAWQAKRDHGFAHRKKSSVYIDSFAKGFPSQSGDRLTKCAEFSIQRRRLGWRWIARFRFPVFPAFVCTL